MIRKPLIELIIDKIVLSKPLFYKDFPEESNTTKNSNVFKNYTCIYTVEAVQYFNSILQSLMLSSFWKYLLAEMKGCKSQIALKAAFWKETENNETKYNPQIYFHYDVQTVVRDLDIDDYFLMIFYQITLSGVQKLLSKDIGRIIESIDGDYINIFYLKSSSLLFIFAIAKRNNTFKKTYSS